MPFNGTVRRGDLLLLWLAGIGLRITVLAVPPLLPAIHASVHLTESGVGALTALPVFLLAIGAVPGSLLVSRMGARRALAVGLVAIALAGALRGIGNSVPLLFAMSIVMGMGIAVSQPALPTLVRQWYPERSGLATAVYSNGFLIGELVAAALSATLILPLAGSWSAALALWSVPVIITALLLLTTTRHVPRVAGVAADRWWPNWRSWLTWRLGLILGGASLAYWSANAFIPDYLRHLHEGALITPALTILNVSQLPASLVVGAFPARVIGKRGPVVAAGILTLAATAGFAAGGWWLLLAAGIMGFATATIFVLTLALPPLLAEPNDVHRLSAATFTISYTCPLAGSLFGGMIWDATGYPISVFSTVAVGGLMMIVLVQGMRLPGTGAPRPGGVVGAP